MNVANASVERLSQFMSFMTATQVRWNYSIKAKAINKCITVDNIYLKHQTQITFTRRGEWRCHCAKQREQHINLLPMEEIKTSQNIKTSKQKKS